MTKEEREQKEQEKLDDIQASLEDLSVRAKLEKLNELTIDRCIINLAMGYIKPNDLGAVVTLLKNNKVVEEKREESEADIIDNLVEEVKK